MRIVNIFYCVLKPACLHCSEAYVYIYVPVQTAISMYILYTLVGNAVFAGVTVILLGMPLTLFVTKYQSKLRKAALEVKDERIRMMNETLTAIKVHENSYD